MQSYTYDLIRNGFDIGVEHMHSSKAVRMFECHCHPHYEIYIQLDGSRTYFIKDRVFIINPGDIVMISPYIMHRTSSNDENGFERVLIDFGIQYLESLCELCPDFDVEDILKDGFCVLSSDVLSNSYLKEVSFRLISESKKHDKCSEAIVRLLLGQIIMLIDRLNQSKATVSAADTKSYKRISDIILFIEKNYADKLTLEGISREYFISYHYLSHAFKDITGMSFTEYLNTVRVAKAREMIDKQLYPLNVISEKVGFGSYKQFGRIFKEITGVSPSQYK